MTVLKSSEETNGEYFLKQLEIALGGGNMLHYHIVFTEEFNVVEGQLNISLNGAEKVLKAGESRPRLNVRPSPFLSLE